MSVLVAAHCSATIANRRGIPTRRVTRRELNDSPTLGLHSAAVKTPVLIVRIPIIACLVALVLQFHVRGSLFNSFILYNVNR